MMVVDINEADNRKALMTMAEEAMPAGTILKAEIPDDDYYKEKIKTLEKRIVELEGKNESLSDQLISRDAKCRALEEKNVKLERALIDHITG